MRFIVIATPGDAKITHQAAAPTDAAVKEFAAIDFAGLDPREFVGGIFDAFKLDRPAFLTEPEPAPQPPVEEAVAPETGEWEYDW